MGCCNTCGNTLPIGPRGPAGADGADGAAGAAGSAGEILTGPNTLWVTSRVDDPLITPEVGNFGWSYLDIQSAFDAASSGDTIMVLPGTYSEDIPTTKDVTYFLMDAEISNGASNVVNLTTANTVNILGTGILKTTTASAVKVTAGTLNIECTSIESDSGSSQWGVDIGSTGTIRLTADRITGGVRDQSSAKNVITVAGVIQDTSYSAVYLNKVSGGETYLKASKITSAGSNASSTVYMRSLGTAAKYFIDCPLIENTANSVTAAPAAGVFIEQSHTDSVIRINGDIIVDAVLGLHSINAGTTNPVTINGSIKSVSNSAIRISATAGSAFLVNGDVQNDSTEETVSLGETGLYVGEDGSGTLEINGRVKSNWNNASGHTIRKEGGTLVLRNAILKTTHASAYSIITAGTQDVIVYNAVANAVTNGTLTERVNTIVVDTTYVQ